MHVGQIIVLVEADGHRAGASADIERAREGGERAAEADRVGVAIARRDPKRAAAGQRGVEDELTRVGVNHADVGIGGDVEGSG